MKATAIFDIGKTNKKFFLFDSRYQQVFKEYTHFDEIRDEDGFPCDDLSSIRQWLMASIEQVLQKEEFDVRSINFSTYGASFVHLDQHGQPVTPLYNYLKPMPEAVLNSFYMKYGDELKLAKETASPPLGMLNSAFNSTG